MDVSRSWFSFGSGWRRRIPLSLLILWQQGVLRIMPIEKENAKVRTENQTFFTPRAPVASEIIY